MSETRERIVTFRATDGTRFQMRVESFTDYFLSRLFLSFAVLCVTVSALATLIVMLATEVDLTVGLLTISFYFFVMVLAVVILWLITVGAALNALVRRGVFRTIHTPLFYIVFLVLANLQFYLFSPIASLDTMIWPAIIAVAIFACIDIMHARFVAPLHDLYVSDGARSDVSSVPASVPEIPQAVANNPVPMAASSPPEAAGSAPPQPQVSEPRPAPEPAPEIKPDARLKIGKQTFQIREILQIRSEDHYLRVKTGVNEAFVRGKLSEVSKRLPSEYGTQVNRSNWVAHGEIESLEEAESGRLVVRLKNGDSIAVPKMRRLLLEQRYEAFRAAATGGNQQADMAIEGRAASAQGASPG